MEYVGADKLFAVHVARYKLPEIVDKLTEVYDYYDADDSLWDYNQTFNVHVLDEHKTVQDTILDVARDFLVDKLKYDCDIQMSTSWLTRTHPEAYGTNQHTHHNSWWSGVYYLHDESVIQIDSTYYSMCNIDVPTTEFSIDSCVSSIYELNKGEMILFPSQTPHMVIDKTNKKYKHIRRSIAFNLLPKGQIGRADSSWVY